PEYSSSPTRRSSDLREGPSAMDEAILAWLRRSGRPFLLVVNKVDGIDLGTALAEFASFGLEPALPVAAAHRRGIDELMSEVLERLPEDGDAEVLSDDPDRIRVAFIGRPNVRKYTLVKRPLGEEHMIAHD